MQKILFIKINPIGTKNLYLDAEEKEIEEIRKKSTNRDHYELESKGAVTIEELHEHLEEYKPTILHISGHGNNEGVLYFHDDENYKKEVSIHRFCRFIKNYNQHLSCIFLNACFSLSGIHNITDMNNQAIIGMNNEIPNDTAIIFSKAFYTSLFGGKSIADSFDSAIGVVGLDGFGDENIPCLKGDALLEIKVEANNPEILAKVDANLVPEENIELAKNKRKKRKTSYYFMIGFVVIVSLFLVGISIYTKQNTLYSIAGVLPLGLVKWIKEKLDGIDDSLTLLKMLENEIAQFLESLKVSQVQGIDEKITQLNEQFWKIVEVNR